MSQPKVFVNAHFSPQKRTFGLIGLTKFGRKLRGSSLASQRQFADVDPARRCKDRNFEMFCLYDVCDVARAVRDNADTGPASQAAIEQARAT